MRILLKVQSEFSFQGATKKFLYTTIIKIFMDQSEMSALPEGCITNGIDVVM